jgi:hypothetical protein
MHPRRAESSAFQKGQVEVSKPFVTVSARVGAAKAQTTLPEPVLLSRDLRHAFCAPCSIADDTPKAFHPRPAW